MKRAKYIPDNIVLSLASPERIRSWSFGEISKAETINYRTGRSERGGLFDERVFGPEKDYQCYCGKYKGIRYKGIVCEKCGVEITRAIVRRDRLGHIELASPVAHIWFLRGVPSRMGLLLDVPLAQLEKVVYFAGYIVTSTDDTERTRILRDLDAEFKLKTKDITDEETIVKFTERFQETKKEIQSIQTYSILSEAQYYTYSMKYSTLFEAGIGAEALHNIFKSIDLRKLEAELVAKQAKSDKASKEKNEKRLSLVRQLITSEQRPEWMFVTTLPVIPPALRPMVALEGGRFATSDINDLYRRVINRNNRLRKLIEIGAPDVILRNEKRILQEAADALFDNSMKKNGNSALSAGQNRQLKSLADNLKGKHGLLRQNLLGKRVDYSGRSVIVVGPTLKIDQCGIPKYMALELFRPFVIAELLKREQAFNIRGANRLIEEAGAEVWEILEHVIEGKYVLLNRAPTLHRLSIQAFHPILIEGKAIQVHPMVCSAFNADFDGDQMAVHVPLSDEAQREARELIAANKNILKPQTGSPVATPAQDIVLGCFWMTKTKPESKGEGLTFGSANEAITAHEYGQVDYHAAIRVVPSNKPKYVNATTGLYLETTVGRLLFNSLLPADYGYINTEVKKKDLEQIIQNLVERYGIDAVAILLDKIKTFGTHYATISGTTFSMDEVRVPERKKDVVAAARAKVAGVNEQYNEGLISGAERSQMTIAIWEEATAQMAAILKEELGKSESIHDMITSGARGSMVQHNQSAGMKGIIQSAQGVLDFPIVSSFKEGQTPIEYFINSSTARKTLADTALKTASAGYLTRRLHDVAQDVVVTEEDCGTKKGIYAQHEVVEGFERSIADNLYGRVIAEPVKDSAGNVVYKRNTLVTKEIAKEIQKLGVDKVLVRTALTCDASYGVCRHCYGLDLGRNILVRLGEAVGTIASQSIGEPGTQLTLRTFHTGGVVGRDITQGLPRVEELFEKRKPKALAVLAQNDGVIADIRTDEKGVVTVEVAVSQQGRATKVTKNDMYEIPFRRVVLVKKGDEIVQGDPITDGSADPVELFQFGGREKAQDYLINEVAKVYEMQSASVARKHLEIIVRQMFCQCRVTDPGDSLLTTGQLVEYIEVFEQNAQIREKNGKEIETSPVLMGITDVATNRRSWLSSASFQHTQRVLTAAAVRGTGDALRGLKENVIIGNLIPAGTGFSSDFIDMSDIEDQTQSAEDKHE
jgi:DNA-directed RNA polymerase subunit beta'